MRHPLLLRDILLIKIREAVSCLCVFGFICSLSLSLSVVVD